ncbi:phosphate ABC transporter permease subunit PstC [candidate division WOR-3 bacterium JGI_Cruoil_03_44_89]|uniref:Phosphate transport system permease protein n=1 Tax=candidate division WOR-3 bacterium JGI_Cruoil_03_44_89 TaxID=1973748 RepID=A0A235BYG9_UNCW3|nr:MAG: phosphate ABC transporter permease subunit PstC [candidate division WOR-3 bacterium JGI_Cruoil_03_44_89]
MTKEKFIKRFFLFFALLSIFFLAGILFVLFKEGISAFGKINLGGFLFGRSWYPTHTPGEFGILPLILGSLLVTVGALVVAVPLGIGSAIYISEVAKPGVRDVIKPLLEILAGIPSVVYGFFGMVVFAPFIQRIFDIPTGLTAFTASVILGIMALPTIASIAEDAISSVPKSYKEASLSLGATEWETIARVTVPSAMSGISAAIILGMGRAIGETMTVLMVAGGAAVIPHTFFQPVRTMTATIAAEMGETMVGGIHYQSLFAIAIVLFLLTLTFNIIADHISHRYKKKMTG